MWANAHASIGGAQGVPSGAGGVAEVVQEIGVGWTSAQACVAPAVSSCWTAVPATSIILNMVGRTIYGCDTIMVCVQYEASSTGQAVVSVQARLAPGAARVTDAGEGVGPESGLASADADVALAEQRGGAECGADVFDAASIVVVDVAGGAAVDAGALVEEPERADVDTSADSVLVLTIGARGNRSAGL